MKSYTGKNAFHQPTYEDAHRLSEELISQCIHVWQILEQSGARMPETFINNWISIGHLYGSWFREGKICPHTWGTAHFRFWQEYGQLTAHMTYQLLSGKPLTPFVPTQDKRFSAWAWQEQPFFYWVHQSYLLAAKHSIDFVETHASLDRALAKKIAFFTRQYWDACSPSNALWTNPEVWERTLESAGENITRGMKHFLEDLQQGKGHWYVRMTDMSAFEVGKNLAATKGKVIFENRLMQLVQYSPLTEEVHQAPLLIVPPWINKYYILDLREKNSFVKWAVEKGITVFMISWVNPDKHYRETRFDAYLFEGIFSALEAIEKALGKVPVNALGFCLGGTLLACALGYMQKKRDKRIASATFLTTLIDFSEPGEVGVFIDEQQIATLEAQMAKEGYLDGRLLMMTFNLLRANDLFWSFYINNYLCGKKPFPLDLLYWNCDSTHLPEKMHSFYLRKMYLENALSQPGKLLLREVPIDLSRVKTPSYFLSTEHDHIAPWKTTFKGAQCVGGSPTFVLGGSGHIAGVINPPEAHKYGFRYTTRSVHSFETAEEWYAKTKEQTGSWWEHWMSWLDLFLGPPVAPRIPGEGGLPAIEEAPGRYVKVRIL